MNYIYYNRNPQNSIENDCVCRAISLALDINYYDVDYLLNKNSYNNSCDKLVKSCYRSLLENEFNLIGYLGHGKTVQQIAKRFKNKKVIMRIYAHLTCSLYGTVYDIFDCTNEKVDEYWIVR